MLVKSDRRVLVKHYVGLGGRVLFNACDINLNDHINSPKQLQQKLVNKIYFYAVIECRKLTYDSSSKMNFLPF